MQLVPSAFKRTLALGAFGALASVGLALGAQPVQAATVPGIYIDVDAYGNGHGTVDGADNLVLSALTATGGGTCALANGSVIIADAGTSLKDTYTDGAICSLYNASVSYTLTYTNAGVSQTFYRSCVWVLGNQTCTARGQNKIN